MQLKPGSKLQNGKYEIVRTLGQGGFGITYEAEQVALHRRVAIKEFFMKDYCDRDESTSHVTLGTSSGSKELVVKFRTKFVREAQMIASQDHPHIVKIYDVFEENGTAYYVMEFLEGGSLADLVKKEGPLSESKSLDLVRQVGDALSHLHGQNCLHFDVKPSNVLLNRTGNAVLIDFGISKHYDEAGSQTSSTPVGISKGFAPLEQYQQSELSTFTPATDIYALGATLFYLLTGQIPPSASEVNEDGLPPFPLAISGPTQRAIIKAMSPRRKDRPQNIDSFFALLTHSPSDGISAKNDGLSLKDIEKAVTTEDEEETIIQEPLSKHQVTSIKKENLRGRKHNTKPFLWVCLFLGIPLIIYLAVFFIPWDNLSRAFAKEDSITINGARTYSFTFGSKGDNRQFNLDKNFSDDWTYSQKPDWCTIQSGSTVFTVICVENTTTKSRSADIIFSKKGSEIILATLTINQEAATPAVITASGISMQSTGYFEASVGESFYINYTISPVEAKNHKVTWSSSDKTVATVSSDGTITAKGSGYTTIYAKVDEVSAKCNLEIRIIPTPTISLSDYYCKMNVGETKTIKAYNYGKSLYWYSEDNRVATVSQTGVVKAVGAGEVKVWARGDESKVCIIKVESSNTSDNTQDTEYINMNVGDSKYLKINGNVPDKVVVDSGKSVIVNTFSGFVSAERSGVTSVTCWYNGQIKRFSITVR